MVRAVRSYAGAAHHPVGATDWNNCTVIALSHAAGVPYSIAHEVAESAGRKYGKGMSVPRLMDAATKRGIYHGGMVLGRSITENREQPTVAQFCQLMPEGRFIIITRYHALAVCDGIIYDNLRTLSKKKRVVAFWRITNIQVAE